MKIDEEDLENIGKGGKTPLQSILSENRVLRHLRWVEKEGSLLF